MLSVNYQILGLEIVFSMWLYLAKYCFEFISFFFLFYGCNKKLSFLLEVLACSKLALVDLRPESFSFYRSLRSKLRNPVSFVGVGVLSEATLHFF
jgi:hypothetical protein